VFQKTYRTLAAQVNGETVKFRAFEKIVYVQNPVEPDYQTLNIYVPEAYFNNGKIIDWVGADKFNIFISRAIVEDDANFGSISNDVLVGGDIAIATDDKAGTGSLGNLTSKERAGGASVGDD